jgi:sigma-E factor negative regulatory protein RseC
MIEETGTVIRLDGDWAVVEPDKTGSCGSCSLKGGCGTASLSRFFSRRRHAFHAKNPVHARPGDTVVMGLEESSLVRGSLIVYLLPLISMILTAGLLTAWAALNDFNQDLMALIGLISGLVFGGFLARILSLRHRESLYPRIIRIDPVR